MIWGLSGGRHQCGWNHEDMLQRIKISLVRALQDKFWASSVPRQFVRLDMCERMYELRGKQGNDTANVQHATRPLPSTVEKLASRECLSLQGRPLSPEGLHRQVLASCWQGKFPFSFWSTVACFKPCLSRCSAIPPGTFPKLGLKRQGAGSILSCRSRLPRHTETAPSVWERLQWFSPGLGQTRNLRWNSISERKTS